MAVLRHTVLPEEEGLTVRDMMTARFHISSTLRKALRTRPEAITRNGAAVPLWTRLCAGDLLALDVSDPRPASPPPAVAMPLSVLWEDDFLLAVDKPAGITVHGAALTAESVTVAAAAAHYLGHSVHVVNRLDRGTTGVMLLAKCSYIHERCMALLQSGGLSREYRAVCDGCPQPPAGVVDAPIGRDETSLLRRCLRPDGQAAVTAYRVLQHAGGRSLLRLCPQTGRTHQLRVHMASIGCPLTGDWLYGTEAAHLIARPALHSHILRFVHPVTGQTHTITAPVPADMLQLL